MQRGDSGRCLVWTRTVDNDLHVPRIVSCYKRNLIGMSANGARYDALFLAGLSGPDIEYYGAPASVNQSSEFLYGNAGHSEPPDEEPSINKAEDQV